MFLDVAVLFDILGRVEPSNGGRFAAIVVMLLAIVGSWGVLGKDD
jgi:hypothetical protein